MECHTNETLDQANDGWIVWCQRRGMDGLVRHLNAMQCHIDQLMLEYCPDEMTPSQKETWANAQRAVKGE
jgi:hypothetical protein